MSTTTKPTNYTKEDYTALVVCETLPLYGSIVAIEEDSYHIRLAVNTAYGNVVICAGSTVIIDRSSVSHFYTKIKPLN